MVHIVMKSNEYISKMINEMAVRPDAFRNYDEVDIFDSTYFIVKDKRGLYNLIDRNGKIISDIWFEKITKNSDGSISVVGDEGGNDGKDVPYTDVKDFEKCIAIQRDVLDGVSPCLPKDVVVDAVIPCTPYFIMSDEATKVVIIAKVVIGGDEFLLDKDGKLYNPDGSVKSFHVRNAWNSEGEGQLESELNKIKDKIKNALDAVNKYISIAKDEYGLDLTISSYNVYFCRFPSDNRQYINERSDSFMWSTYTYNADVDRCFADIRIVPTFDNSVPGHYLLMRDGSENMQGHGNYNIDNLPANVRKELGNDEWYSWCWSEEDETNNEKDTFEYVIKSETIISFTFQEKLPQSLFNILEDNHAHDVDTYSFDINVNELDKFTEIFDEYFDTLAQTGDADLQERWEKVINDLQSKLDGTGNALIQKVLRLTPKDDCYMGGLSDGDNVLTLSLMIDPFLVFGVDGAVWKTLNASQKNALKKVGVDYDNRHHSTNGVDDSHRIFFKWLAEKIRSNYNKVLSKYNVSGKTFGVEAVNEIDKYRCQLLMQCMECIGTYMTHPDGWMIIEVIYNPFDCNPYRRGYSIEEVAETLTKDNLHSESVTPERYKKLAVGFHKDIIKMIWDILSEENMKIFGTPIQ